MKFSEESPAKRSPTRAKPFSQNQHVGVGTRPHEVSEFPLRYAIIQNMSPDGNVQRFHTANTVSTLADNSLSVRQAFGTVLFELAVKRGLADTQQSRGGQLISVGFAQRT
jgi:hypothetical protein